MLVVGQLVAIGQLRMEAEGASTERTTAPVEPPRILEPPPAHPLVGAHYHLWYPSNFDQGTLRAELVPPQQPALGRYRSDDPSVAEAHIAAATAHGIDFFTLDWWPSRTTQNANALSGFLRADNVGDIDFAIFYEVWDLGFDAANEATPMDPPTIERFATDMEQLATTFFDHPSYLRVDDRPVVILYLSRTMTGDVAGAIAAARQRLSESGVDVFFIGDEVFWRPLDADRMRLYDAITAYNLYSSDRPEHRGHASETSFVPDQLALYREHATAAGVPLVPAVLPGYNDRGVRPTADHYAIPRRWAPDAAEGTLLRELIDRVARPLLDPRLPMVFVTSWNEWNEDTAIEPLSPAPETATDRSETRSLFTEGHAYGGGDLQLRALRDEVVAVAGRAMDADRARPGVRVEARDPSGRLLAADVTDSAGRYVLSRWLLRPGTVLLSSGGAPVEVDVLEDRTVHVDLRVVRSRG